MTWDRMLEQMQWRSPFGDLPDAWKGRRFRRAPWPKKAVHWERSTEGETLVWHIWHVNDCGDQSTFEGGLVQGWGGQLGADNSEIVSVNGAELRDGTMYAPTYDDLNASDWETV